MKLQERVSRLGGLVPIRGEELTPMTPDEVAALEAQLGKGLPSSYREFLLSYGATGFRNSVSIRSLVPLPARLSETGDVRVSFFYGADDPSSVSAYSLTKSLRLLEGRVPPSLISIGGETFGNQILLGIHAPDTGRVYYWDHENEWDEEDYLEDYGVPMPPEVMYQNVYLLAESFDEFLDRLTIEED